MAFKESSLQTGEVFRNRAIIAYRLSELLRICKFYRFGLYLFRIKTKWIYLFFLFLFAGFSSTELHAQVLPDATQDFTGYSNLDDGTDRWGSPDNFFILNASRPSRINADQWGAFLSDAQAEGIEKTDWFEITPNPASDLGGFEVEDIFIGEYDYGVSVARFQNVIVQGFQGETMVAETIPFTSQSDNEETRYPIDYSVFEGFQIDRFRVTFTTNSQTPPDVFNLVEFTIKNASTEAPEPPETSVPLSESPTLTFTENSADITGDNIASDGEGGSQAISDIEIQVFNISDEDGTFLNSLDWKGHDFLGSGDSNYSGLTYDNNNEGNKGMSIKSADGSEFRLIQFTYYNWGESSSFTNTIKGYRDGTEVASMTFDGFDPDWNPQTVTLGESFSNVDDVRLYISGAGWNGDGTTNHSINNIQITTPVEIEAGPPVFTSTPVTEVEYDQAYTYEATADSDGDLDITISAVYLPDWLTLGATLSGTPSKEDVGTHDVILRATNTEGYIDQEFTIEVTDNVPPVAESFTPPHNETDVDHDTELSITFDEEITFGETGVLHLHAGTDDTPFASFDLSVTADKNRFDISEDERTLTFNYGTSFHPGTEITVTLSEGFVEDAHGNQFAGFDLASGTWQFTTGDVFAGGSGTEIDPYQVATAEQLNSVRDFLDKHFIQTADIDLGVSPYNEDSGWEPIGGTGAGAFTGSFDGNGNMILNLSIDHPDLSSVGLFRANAGKMINIKLYDADIKGESFAGALTGRNDENGIIENSNSTGILVSDHTSGGLVGLNGGVIRFSGSSVDVSGIGSIGGLVGINGFGGALIEHSHATGNVIGILDEPMSIGGLVGSNRGSTIRYSYATGSVKGNSGVGGLVGNNRDNGAIIENAYSSGSVNAVGEEMFISDVGGLVGSNRFDAHIKQSYSFSAISGFTNGGLVGRNQATVLESYWDIEASGQTSSDAGIGLTTSEMKSQSTFTDAGWDFDNVWQIDELQNGSISYPYLQNNIQDPAPGYLEVSMPTVVTNENLVNLTSNSVDVTGEVTDDGNLEITQRGFVWATDAAPGDTTLVLLGSGEVTFTETISDLPPATALYVRSFATNMIGTVYGDLVSFETGTGELLLTGSFTVLEKVYDGETAAVIDQNSLSLGGVYSGHNVEVGDVVIEFEDADAGTDKQVSVQSVSLSGDDAGRYTISLTGAPQSVAVITPRKITITVDPQQVVYGVDDPFMTYEITSGDFVTGDKVSGELERDPGLDVGKYAIQQGDLSAGSNYDITYQPADFEITPRELTIMADAGQSKNFGEIDPELTFDAANFGWKDNESLLSGVLGRKSGEDAGQYAITLGDLSAGDNYTIKFIGDEFSITPKMLTVKADPGQHKFIGADDPVFTFTVEGFMFKDDESLISGGLDRQSGENTGEYALLPGSVDAGPNYSIDFVSDVFTIIMTPPVVVETSQSDGQTDLPTSSEIYAGFDQPVFAGDLDLVAVTDAAQNPLSVTATVEDNTLKIHHDGLQHLTTYTVTIPPGSLVNSDEVENESHAWSFTTSLPAPDPVTLSAPNEGEGSIGRTPELTWQSSDGAATYRVQISDTDGFDNLLVDADQLEATSYEAAEALDYYGTYYWRVQASNSSGDSEWSDTGSFVTLARTPDLLFPAHQQVEVSTAPVLEWSTPHAGSPYRVQLSAGANFTELLSDSLVSGPAAVLQGLDDGQDYYWRVRLESENTTSAWAGEQRFRTRGAPAASQHEQHVQGIVEFGGTSSGQRQIAELDYRLMGLPGEDRFRIDDFLEGDYGTEWKAFLDTGAEVDYFQEFDPDDERFVFTPGQGFWVLSKHVLEVNTSIQGVSVHEGDAYSIELNPGWNIISNPHQHAVSWQDVLELNEINGDLFGYNERFVSVDSLHALQGYYYYNDIDSPAQSLEIPYTGMDQRRKKSEPNFQLAAHVTAGSSRAVISAEFENGHDFDVELVYGVAAEKQGTYLRYHPSLEMSRYGMVLTDESIGRGGLLRGESVYREDGSSYYLELKGKVGSTFTWTTDLDGLDSHASVLIVNPVTQKSWILEDGDHAEAVLTEPHATYEVYVGDEYYLQEKQQNMLPMEISMEPNYPNPFNPVTNIRYSIPQQQHVRLEVYDVIGRRVSILVDSVQQPGWHVVQFDGRNLASGVYFYRIAGDNMLQVRQMTLIK